MEQQEERDFVQQAISSREFTSLIEEAAPYRVKIDTDLRREMKEVKGMFVNQVAKSDKRLQDIFKKDKKARTEEDREYVRSAMKAASREFNSVKRIVHPAKGSSADAAERLVSKVAEVARMLKYIGRTDIEDAFAKAGISISVPALEDENEYFAKEGSREIMADIFHQADEVQKSICSASDKIKIELFEALPETVRFEKDRNERGIRPPQFAKLARTKAVALEKSPLQFDKFKRRQIASARNGLVAKRIEAEKIKEI